MIIITSICISVVLASIVYLLFSQMDYEKIRIEKRVKDSMRKIHNEDYSNDKYAEMNIVNKKVKKKTKIYKSLTMAGIKIDHNAFILIQVMVMIALMGIGYMRGIDALICLLLPAFWLMFIVVMLSVKTKKRKAKFNEQLPEFITQMISALRVGHSLNQAIKAAVENSASPIKEEFEIFLKLLNYGVDFKEAFEDIYNRVGSQEIKIMSNAILIQKEVGGNVIKMLEIIHRTIKERETLERKIKTLTAQGRLSGFVIGFMPIIILFAVLMISPDFIMPLFTTTYGKIGIASGLILEITGLVFIKKIVEIEV